MPRHLTDKPAVDAAASHRQGRHRRRGSVIAHRHPQRGRFATVWPCAQDDVAAGTGVLASWLLNAVIKVVTTYSMPGHRILLLAPSPTVLRAPRRPGPYGGLFEAAWSVIRLGRGVQTGLAGPHVESGLRTVSPDSPTGLFDVIVTAAEPQAVAAIRPTSWSRLLTPRGVLVVITHSDRTGPRFCDPAVSMVQNAHVDGLRYLDHIAVLQMPIDDTEPNGDVSAVRVRAHVDLHVFSPRVATHAMRETCG